MRTLSERLGNLHWKQFDRAAPVLLTFLILSMLETGEFILVGCCAASSHAN